MATRRHFFGLCPTPHSLTGECVGHYAYDWEQPRPTPIEHSVQLAAAVLHGESEFAWLARRIVREEQHGDWRAIQRELHRLVEFHAAPLDDFRAAGGIYGLVADAIARARQQRANPVDHQLQAPGQRAGDIVRGS